MHPCSDIQQQGKGVAAKDLVSDNKIFYKMAQVLRRMLTRMCVCVCVRACVRVRVFACVHVRVRVCVCSTDFFHAIWAVGFVAKSTLPCSGIT